MKVGRVERIGKAGPQVVHDAESSSPDSADWPKFPSLKGPADDLARVITCDLPYEHKALCILAWLGLEMSGRVCLASEPYLQPRFYVCMVGPPGTGKSSTEKEARRQMTRVLEDIHIEFSIDSGPALIEALSQHRRLMLACDEMADVFEKGRQTPGAHNSLLGELLKLYEGNETGRRVIKKNAEPISITDAHFALIGSATPERFDRMWQGTAGASGGLQSRFVLSYSEQVPPALRTPNQETAIEVSCDALREVATTWRSDFQPQTIKLSGDAQDLIVAWRSDDQRAAKPRMLDMAKRFALIIAASGNRSEIDVDTMARGLQFAEYQIGLHDKLMPADASGWAQAFENRILSFLKRHRQASERDIRRSICPEKYPGGFGAFSQALTNLVKTGALITEGANRVGKPIWRLD